MNMDNDRQRTLDAAIERLRRRAKQLAFDFHDVVAGFLQRDAHHLKFFAATWFGEKNDQAAIESTGAPVKSGPLTLAKVGIRVCQCRGSEPVR